MLLKKFLIFKRYVGFRNGFDLAKKAILFKRGGGLLCYWCDSRNLCKELILKYEIIDINLISMESFCVNLDERFRLDDHKYTLYAIQEASNIQGS